MTFSPPCIYSTNYAVKFHPWWFLILLRRPPLLFVLLLGSIHTIAIPITISGVSRDVSQSLLTRGWTWGHCGYQFNKSLIHRTCCCCLIRYLLSVLIYCCFIWFFRVKKHRLPFTSRHTVLSQITLQHLICGFSKHPMNDILLLMIVFDFSPNVSLHSVVVIFTHIHCMRFLYSKIF